jgi:hypothetical protein
VLGVPDVDRHVVKREGRRIRNGKRRRAQANAIVQAARPIRCAYADPVYPGRSPYYLVEGTPEYHPDAARWDDLAEHVALMGRLDAGHPDGWAMSTSSDAARELWHAAPPGTQLAVWSRGGPRLNLRVVPGWEAVLYRTSTIKVPGRPQAMDWLMCGIGHTSRADRGFYGAKPPRFCRWLFALLGLGGHPADELVDLFPGSGAVTRAWADYRALAIERRGVTQRSLFA